MTRDAIINLADSWSERKGKQFDLQTLYEVTVQHICKQSRFWWRKKIVTFSLTVNTKTYDLTSITTSPVLTETGVEEVIKWVVTTVASPLTTVELTPIFDDEGIIAMVANTVADAPSRYVMGYDALQTLRIDPPDQAYSTSLSFWAMPNFTAETTSTTVPLIPDWHHRAIAEGMASQILENTYGLQDIKASTMRARYQASIIDMQNRPRFTTNYVQSLASSEDAVQST